MAKQYSQSQWAQIMKRLPEEDRTPYSTSPDAVDYVQSAGSERSGGLVTTKPTPMPVMAQTGPRGEYTKTAAEVAVAKTAEKDAVEKEVEEEQKVADAKVVAEGGYAGPNTIGKLAGLVNDSEFNEDYINEFIRDNPESFDKETVTEAIVTAESIIVNKPEFKDDPAFTLAQSILSQYGISGFILALAKIREDYPNADSETIVQLFQYDERYNGAFLDRFSGNKARKLAGLPMLSGAEYLKMEQGYKKIFTSYGLDRFSNTDYYAKLIGNDADIQDITDRLALGYTRLLNDKTTLDAFNRFFPSLDTTDIFAAMMDPEQQIPELKRKITAAEIGGQAAFQSLTSSYSEINNGLLGTLGANALGNAGVTEATAKTGYQSIAGVLPISSRLSGIYGGTAEQYGQKEAEQEQFLGLESAARKRRKLSELETQQFAGSSGTNRYSLTKAPSAGQY